MRVGQVRVACGRAVAPVPEQFPDQQQAFARHDGMTRGGMPEGVQAFADRNALIKGKWHPVRANDLDPR